VHIGSLEARCASRAYRDWFIRTCEKWVSLDRSRRNPQCRWLGRRRPSPAKKAKRGFHTGRCFLRAKAKARVTRPSSAAVVAGSGTAVKLTATLSWRKHDRCPLRRRRAIASHKPPKLTRKQIGLAEIFPRWRTTNAGHHRHRPEARRAVLYHRASRRGAPEFSCVKQGELFATDLSATLFLTCPNCLFLHLYSSATHYKPTQSTLNEGFLFLEHRGSNPSLSAIFLL
jgi:hypothetical protein